MTTFTLTEPMIKLLRAEWLALNREYPLLGKGVEGRGGGPGSYLWRITAQMNEVFPGIACHTVASCMQTFGRIFQGNRLRPRNSFTMLNYYTRPVWKVLFLRILMNGAGSPATYKAIKRRYRMACLAEGQSAVELLGELAALEDAMQ